MITSISIENFKGIGDRVDLTFKPITLLFGANSAGKSTILQALHYAREVFCNRNLDADQTAAGGECVRLGGFRHFLHNHDMRRPLVLKIGFRFPSILSFADYFKEDEDWGVDEIFRDLSPDCGAVELTIRWFSQLRAPFVTQYRLELDGVHAGTLECNPERKEVWVTELNTEHPLFVVAGATEDDIDDTAVWRLARGLPIALAGVRDALPPTDDALSFGTGELDGPRFRDDAERGRQEAAFSNIFLAPLKCLRWDLHVFRFLGAMRTLPPFGWQPNDGNDATWSDGAAAWRRLLTCNEEFLDRINAWLATENKLDTGYRLRCRKMALIDQASPLWLGLTSGCAFDETEDQAQQLNDLPNVASIVLLDERRGGLEVAPHDVGIGVSQLVPILVSCLDRIADIPLTRTIAIDTPELHLHPRQIAALGDLFIDAGLGANEQWVILETHSEHLILRLQRRIREHAKGLATNSPAITSNDVAVYHVAQRDGQTTVNQIELDQNGDFIQPWPDDFFEIDFYERFGHAD